MCPAQALSRSAKNLVSMMVSMMVFMMVSMMFHDENIPYLAQHEQLLIAGGRSDQVDGGYWWPYQFFCIFSFIDHL